MEYVGYVLYACHAACSGNFRLHPRITGTVQRLRLGFGTLMASYDVWGVLGKNQWMLQDEIVDLVLLICCVDHVRV